MGYGDAGGLEEYREIYNRDILHRLNLLAVIILGVSGHSWIPSVRF